MRDMSCFSTESPLNHEIFKHVELQKSYQYLIATKSQMGGRIWFTNTSYEQSIHAYAHTPTDCAAKFLTAVSRVPRSPFMMWPRIESEVRSNPNEIQHTFAYRQNKNSAMCAFRREYAVQRYGALRYRIREWTVCSPPLLFHSNEMQFSKARECEFSLLLAARDTQRPHAHCDALLFNEWVSIRGWTDNNPLLSLILNSMPRASNLRLMWNNTNA